MIDLISIIFLVILSGAAGRKCLGLIKFQSFSKDDNALLLISIGLGFGIISYSIYFLGILSLLYKWVLWTLLIMLVVFLRREMKDFCISISRLTVESVREIPKLSRFNQALLISLASYLILNLIGAFSPLIETDPLAYNLLAPKRFLLSHRIYFLPDNLSQSNSHLGMEMLYIPSMALIGGETLPQLIQYATGILAALTIIIFCKRHLNSVNIGLLAGVIFYSQPAARYLSAIPKIDLGIVFYFMLMVFSFFIWAYDSEGDDDKWLLLSSIFLGLAATAKLTGIFFFPPFFAAVLLACRFYKKLDWRMAIFKAFKYGTIGFMIVLPWCAKSYYFFGDPIHPFLTSAGSGGYIPSPVKMSFLEFLSLPWNMVFHMEKIREGGSPASVVFLGFLPFLFLLTRKDKKILYLLAFSIVWIAQFYAAGGITARWILPSFALLSIVYAFSLIRFFENSQKYLKAMVMGALLVYVTLIHVEDPDSFERLKRLPVVLGLESRDDYLSRSLEFYDTFQYANKNLPSDAKVFDPWEVRGYYLDRAFFSGNLYNRDNQFGEISRMTSCRAAVEKLRERGVTHVMKNVNYHNLLLWMYDNKLISINPTTNIFYKPCMDKYLERIYDSKNVYLYAIKSPLPSEERTEDENI